MNLLALVRHPLGWTFLLILCGSSGSVLGQEIEREDRSRIYQPGSPQQRTELRPAEPIPIQPGPQLLMDDALIESSDNLKRVVQVPQRDPSIPNPIVEGGQDRCFQPYLTVSRAPESGRFRLWYGTWREDKDRNHSHLAYLESDDGIHWIRPTRILQDPGVLDFGSEVIDRGPEFPNPSERYVYSYYRGGLRLAVSPDGIHFRPFVDRPLIEHNHDINNLAWDPLRKDYVAIVSTMATHPRFNGRRRTTMQSVSRDLLGWETPWYVLRADDVLDEGETQFYGLQGFLARGPLWIGMVKVLRDDLRADGTDENAYGMGWTTLAWTRDGKTWIRDREIFFGPEDDPDAWDHAHAWIDEQVVVDGDVYLYYGGYKQGHKMNRFTERQIGLVKMPLDRYVAREASPGMTATLTTVPMIAGPHPARLIINADASKGGMRVQIEDAHQGEAIPGLSFDDCQPIRSDGLRLPIRWGSSGETAENLKELSGRTIRLRFELTGARIFSFDLTEAGT